MHILKLDYINKIGQVIISYYNFNYLIVNFFNIYLEKTVQMVTNDLWSLYI